MIRRCYLTNDFLRCFIVQGRHPYEEPVSSLTTIEDDSEEIDDGAGEVHHSEDDWLESIGFDGEDSEGKDKMSVDSEDILELEDESLGSEDEEFEDEGAMAVKGKSKAIGKAKGKRNAKGKGGIYPPYIVD